MTEAYLLPGVSYALSLADGIAARAHPRNPQPEVDAARREARNLARLIDWAVLPLVKGAEKEAYTDIAARLFRFGHDSERITDYPDQPDPTQTLSAQFDELARRVEDALAGISQKKGGER